MSLYTVSSSPHIRTNSSIQRIMLDVVLALIPAGLVSVYFYGGNAFLVILLGVLSAVLAEALIQKLQKKPVTINDFSAVVTGMLLAYNLPPTAPWWLPVIGSAIAIALVKHVFGGLGHNFMNPALAARAILLAAWPARMTAWVQPGVDAVSTVTPLAVLKGMETAGAELPSLLDLFIGNMGGTIGEVSKAALLLGAAYLFLRGVISWRIPVTFIATTAILVALLGGEGLNNTIYHILSGGLILGAFFMATDYSSSPVTPKGQIIMGIGCGLITAVIRIYGGYPEGVSYSILIMNVVSPLIDKLTMPRIFGEVKQHA
jgi:electron transport complex protein RnfD